MLTRVLAAILFGLLSFDFRGEEAGGGVFQYIVVALGAILFGALLLLNCSKFSSLDFLQKRISFALFLLLMIATLVAAKNHIPWDRYIRVIMPVAFGVFSFVFISLNTQNRSDAKYLSSCLIFASILSAIWKVCYAFLFLGVSIDTLRYQLLSQGTGVAFAWSFFNILACGKRAWWWFVILIGSSTSIILSLTRTHLFSACLVAALIAYVLFKIRGVAPRILYAQGLGVVAVGAAIFTFILAPLILYMRPEVFDLWRSRLFESRARGEVMDPTAAMRIAQIRGQAQDFVAHPVDILLGRGFGNSYELDVDYYLDVAATSSLREEDKQILISSNWQNADSLYIPAAYCGGIYFISLILTMMYVALKPLRVVSAYYLNTELFSLYGPVMASIVYMAGVGLFGNFLLDRFGSPLFFGLLAVAIGIRRQLCSNPPRRRVQERVIQ